MRNGESDILRWMGRHERTLLVLLVLVGAGFYLANVTHYVDQPLRIEENEWPQMAKGTYDHGVPIIKYGEDHRVDFSADGTIFKGDKIGLWHPPAYMYSMVAFMAVAGPDSENALRLIGVMGMVVCCFMLFLLAREITPGRTAFRLGAIASFLFLVHPYAIQGSLFLDIDTSLYTAAFLFFLWQVARYERRRDYSTRAALLLGAALALVLWVKLTTVLVFLPVLPLFWAFRAGIRRGLVHSAVIIGSGTAIFFSTYWLYVLLTGQSFQYLFDVTFSKTDTHSIVSQGSIAPIVFMLKLQAAWFLPALLIMAAVYGIVAFRRWYDVREVSMTDLLWGTGVAIFLMYAFVVPNGSIYGSKYAVPAVPMLIFAVTAMLLGIDREKADAAAEESGSQKLWIPVALTALVSLALILVMPDLISRQKFLIDNWGIKLLIVAGSAAALWIVARGLGFQRWAPGALIVLLAVFFLIQSVHSWRANVSPLFPGTDTADFIRSGEIVNEELRPGEAALVSKDLGIRIDGPVIEGEAIWTFRGDEFEAQAIRDNPWISVMATNSFGPPIGPLTKAVRDECFTKMDVGRDAVYIRKKEKCGRGPLRGSG